MHLTADFEGILMHYSCYPALEFDEKGEDLIECKLLCRRESFSFQLALIAPSAVARYAALKTLLFFVCFLVKWKIGILFPHFLPSEKWEISNGIGSMTSQE